MQKWFNSFGCHFGFLKHYRLFKTYKIKMPMAWIAKFSLGLPVGYCRVQIEIPHSSEHLNSNAFLLEKATFISSKMFFTEAYCCHMNTETKISILSCTYIITRVCIFHDWMLFIIRNYGWQNDFTLSLKTETNNDTTPVINKHSIAAIFLTSLH